MSPSHLIAEAHNDIYCKLAPSPIHGVGVFALKDIPINTVIFRVNLKTITVDSKFLNRIHINVANYYNSMLLSNLSTIEIPETGMSVIPTSYYLNHSEESNAKIDIENNLIVAKKNIYADEEVTINYKGLSTGAYSFL